MSQAPVQPNRRAPTGSSSGELLLLVCCVIALVLVAYCSSCSDTGVRKGDAASGGTVAVLTAVGTTLLATPGIGIVAGIAALFAWLFMVSKTPITIDPVVSMKPFPMFHDIPREIWPWPFTLAAWLVVGFIVFASIRWLWPRLRKGLRLRSVLNKLGKATR